MNEIVTLLIRHGLIDSAAIDDSEGYDGYKTWGQIVSFANDLDDKLMQNNKDNL